MRIVFVRHGRPDYATDSLTSIGKLHAIEAAERGGLIMDIATVLNAMKEKLDKTQTISVDACKKMFKEISKETGIKGRPLFHSLRVAITGEEQGPALDKLSVIIGRNLMASRLKNFIKKFQRMG